MRRIRPRLRRETATRRRRPSLSSRRRLAARRRVADSLIGALINQDEFGDLYSVLHGDEQSIDLIEAVYSYFFDKLDLSRAELEAFQRLRTVTQNARKWDVALLRNNIFKAAHALGLELPSHMF